MSACFNIPIINALWRTCTGERFEYTDPKLCDFMAKLKELLILFGDNSNMLILSYPKVFEWFPTLLKRDVQITAHVSIMNMIKESITEHQQTIDVNESRDFIDTYLNEMADTKDPSSSFYGEKGMVSLVSTMLDLFVAGSETTSTLLTWAMLYMAREPKVQQRVQAEIDDIVGRGR